MNISKWWATALVCVGVLVAVGILFLLGHSRDTSGVKKLNVVVISIDSLRVDHMGMYGYNRNTTPHIDAFSARAAVFNNYFSTSFLTPISESSVHTGRYPLANGMINFETPLRSDVPTLAEILRASGRKTAAFGSSLEFQRYPALRGSFMRAFDTYDINTGATSLPWGGRGELGIGKAIAWTREQIASREPFFLWVTVGSAHWPYGEDEPHHFSDSKYKGLLSDLPVGSDSTLVSVFNNQYGRVFWGALYDDREKVLDPNFTADIAYVRNRYDDGLVKTDRMVAELLDFLATPGVAASTIVIIQSEHGEDFGDHGYIGHYDITDTQTHVPLIIKIPGLPARRVDALASGVDIVPTLLDALNIRKSEIFDGVSLMGPMTGARSAVRNEVYLTRTPLWERVISPVTPWLSEFVKDDDRTPFFDTAIRTKEWKLIHRGTRAALLKYSWWGHLTGIPIVLPEYELYHIAVDPLERTNVYSAQNSIARELRQKLSEWESSTYRLPEAHQHNEQIQPYF